MALAIAGAVLVAALVLMGLWWPLGSLVGIIGDSRRSWRVAALWLITLASAGLLGVMLAASQPAWRIALVLAISVVTFVYANLLSERR